ncbi:MAG: ABC transporter substrate-binding protein, partial [Frankia sp.]
GTPITSADIKEAVERVFATDVISGGPTYFLCILTKCNTSGESPYKGPYADKKGLSSIETPDAQTITFKLVKPFADFNYLMQLPGAAPVPAAKDTRDKYAQHPVASGPYKIQSYSAGKSLVLVRNTAWDPSTDSVRKALPDKINVVEGLDAQDEDNRVLAGTLDLELEQTGVQVPTQSKVLRDATLKANSFNSVTGFLRYVSIQTKVAPFDNVNCRIAVQYAIDKTALQTARGGPITGGAIATTLFPPTLAGYHKFDLYPDGAGNHGNIAQAKSYLAKCGKPNGFSTVMATSSKGKGPKDAVAVQQALAKVGIKVTIDLRSSSTYYSNDIGTPSNVKAKGYGLADAGWGPDWPAPYGFVESIVDGRAIKSSGNSNYSELNDPRVNGAIDAGLAADGTAASVAAISKLDDYVMQDANIVPFVYDNALNIFSKHLTNVYITKAQGMIDFVNLGVSG